MQFAVSAFGYLPAKTIELRLIKDSPDYEKTFTFNQIRSLESLSDTEWIPYLDLRLYGQMLFNDIVKDKLRATHVYRRPLIPLNVPAPFIYGQRQGEISHAYYEFTNERRRVLDDLDLAKKPNFALCVDGFMLVWNRVIPVSAALRDKDSLGNPIEFKNPYLVFRLCEGYNKLVEAIVSTPLPFEMMVLKD